MEIKVLKNFLAVAEEGSLTAAASSLHISQSALSRQIADLEEELGTQLFVRSNRNSVLTEDGIRFQERANRITELSDQTLEEFAGRTKKLSGSISICTAEEGTRPLAAVIRQFHLKYPDVKYRINACEAEEAVKALELGNADFALLKEPFPKDPYHVLSLGIEKKTGLLMRYDDPLALNAVIPHEALKKTELLVFHRFIDPRFLKKMEISRRELSIIGTYTALESVFALVLEGAAAALCTEPDHIPEGLVFKPLDPAVTYETVLAWRKHHLLSNEAEAFLAEIRNTI